MNRSSEQYSFWLTPNSEAEEFLSALIRSLASRVDAPVFAPHLTVQGASSDKQAALSAMQKISAKSSYELEVEEIDVSQSFTKTLFVRFRPSTRLNELRTDLARILQLPSGSPFDPHLSLLYKEMDLSEKKKLARTIELPMTKVCFEGLGLIAHPADIRTRQDVEAWRTIYHLPLGKTSR